MTQGDHPVYWPTARQAARALWGKTDSQITSFLNQTVVDKELAEQSLVPEIDHHMPNDDPEFELVGSDDDADEMPVMEVSDDEEEPEAVIAVEGPEPEEPNVEWKEFFEAIKRPIQYAKETTGLPR